MLADPRSELSPLPPLNISHEELAALIAWNSAQQQAAVLGESYGLAQRHKDRAGELSSHASGLSTAVAHDLRNALCNLRDAVESHIAAADLGEGWDETIVALKDAEESAMQAILLNRWIPAPGEASRFQGTEPTAHPSVRQVDRL